MLKTLDIIFRAYIPDEEEDIYAELSAHLSSVLENCEENGINGPPYDVGETARFRYYTNMPELPVTAGTTNGAIVVNEVIQIEESACEVVFIEEDTGVLSNLVTAVIAYWWKGTVDGFEPPPVIQGLKVSLSRPVTGVLVIEYDKEYMEVQATPDAHEPTPAHIQVCQGNLVTTDSYEVKEKTCCDQCDSEVIDIYHQTELVTNLVVEVDPARGVLLTITGGCPPYTWTASGGWLRMATDVEAPRHFETDPIEWLPGPPSFDMSNTLRASECACRDPNEGAEGSVTVTDDCGTDCIVRIQISKLCCVGDLKVDRSYLPVEIHDNPESVDFVGVLPVDGPTCTGYSWSVEEGSGVEFRDHDTGPVVCLHRSDAELCGPIVVRCEDECARVCDIPVTEIPRNTCCIHYSSPEPSSESVFEVEYKAERGEEYRVDFRGGKPPYSWEVTPGAPGWVLKWPSTSAPTNYITPSSVKCIEPTCSVTLTDACDQTASITVEVDEQEFKWYPDNPTEFPPSGSAIFRVVGGALDIIWELSGSDDFHIVSSDPENPETGPLPVGREVTVVADDPCSAASGGFDLAATDACESQLNCHVTSEPLEFKWHEDTWTGTYGFGYAELYLENGVPPFQWSVVSGDGHIVTLETWDRHNVVFRDICAEGNITVECEDACFDTISTTLNVPESLPIECSDSNPELIAPNASEDISIIYGTGPFTWEVSGGNCTLAHVTTSYRTNILHAPSGCTGAEGEEVTITVTDICDDSVSCTVQLGGNPQFAASPGNPSKFPSSAGVSVGTVGGKKPLNWSVSAGFNVAFAQTMGNTNYITLDGTCSQYDICEVTVTDACNTEVVFTVQPPEPKVVVKGPKTIFHGISKAVSVRGGMEPFEWDLSGSGFELAEPDADGRINTIIPNEDCSISDQITVTATDDCDESDSLAIQVEGEDGPLVLSSSSDEVSALQVVKLLLEGSGRPPYEWSATNGFEFDMPITNRTTNKMHGTEECTEGDVTVTVVDYCEEVVDLEIPIIPIEDMVMTLPETYSGDKQGVSIVGGRPNYVWDVSDGWTLGQEVTGGQSNQIAEEDPCTELVTVSAEGACGYSDSKSMEKTLPTMEWDGPETIEGICSVHVIGGTAPLRWEVSAGFAIGSEYTGASGYNTVSTVEGYCGVAHVTVTDRCGKLAHGYILTVGGSWHWICSDGRTAGCGGAGPGFHSDTVEAGKRVVRRTQCLPNTWPDGYCASCGGFGHCASDSQCTMGTGCRKPQASLSVYEWWCD